MEMVAVISIISPYCAAQGMAGLYVGNGRGGAGRVGGGGGLCRRGARRAQTLQSQPIQHPTASQPTTNCAPSPLLKLENVATSVGF